MGGAEDGGQLSERVRKGCRQRVEEEDASLVDAGCGDEGRGTFVEGGPVFVFQEGGRSARKSRQKHLSGRHESFGIKFGRAF